jgi:triphosphoribosyl-dephospho-CoA synthase
MRDMRRATEAIRAAYVAACQQELQALKPGNVHIFAGGHRMSPAQFLDSALASSFPLTDPNLPIGRRILGAVHATRKAVGMNTNLGIILLSAPLACAAEQCGARSVDSMEGHVALRRNLDTVLRSMTMDDAKAVFEAIVLASPGGLGTVEANDVRNAPVVPLLEAMRQASGHDMIARQYVTAFEDVFATGLAAHDQAFAGGEHGMWPAVFTYMAFLAAFPDSHVARKFGMGTATAVRQEALAVRSSLEAISSEPARIELLGEFDRHLKARDINPGTSADLTVACLLVHNLRGELA